MRVRVRFRYNQATGEVETFVVEDIGGTRHGRDHDAVHEAVAADVARVIERHALIEEIAEGQTPHRPEAVRRPDDEVSVDPEARPISE